MKTFKDITLIGKYLQEAAGTAFEAVNSSLDKVYVGIANSYFGDASDLNKVFATIASDSGKYAAVRRNIFYDERGQLGGGRKTTPPSNQQGFEMDLQNVIALLLAGTVTLGAVGYASNKDMHVDQIDSSIAYLQALFSGAFDTPASTSIDVAEYQLSPEPDVNPVVNETVPKQIVSEEEAYDITINSNPDEVIKELNKKYDYFQNDHQYTSDVKFFGNETFHKEQWKPYDYGNGKFYHFPEENMTYEEMGQNALDELKKYDYTIGGMHVYDFVTKYLDEMHEGREGSGPDGISKPGVEYFPATSPSTMIHHAVHQSGLDVKYADLLSNKKEPKEWVYRMEEFAVRVEQGWFAKKLNYTPEQTEEKLAEFMEQYK